MAPPEDPSLGASLPEVFHQLDPIMKKIYLLDPTRKQSKMLISLVIVLQRFYPKSVK